MKKSQTLTHKETWCKMNREKSERKKIDEQELNDEQEKSIEINNKDSSSKRIKKEKKMLKYLILTNASAVGNRRCSDCSNWNFKCG